MISSFLLKIFKSRNERVLFNYQNVLTKINEYEKNLLELTNEEIKTKSLKLKESVRSGQKNLNDIKVEAFAICREMSKRILGMRHFDVQIIGGLVLHEGKISEMRTGEGKTLSATLAAYLNGLSGKGVHVFTVNDYLAERDANITKPLFEALGLTVGAILSNQTPEEKRDIYKKDIIYGTNSEFGFDYLRNNLVTDVNDLIQGELNYAIIDEVDSILIDEARTPLIISDMAEDSSAFFTVFNDFALHLTKQTDSEKIGHFTVDEEKSTINITDYGYEHIEKELMAMGLIHNHYEMYHDNGLKFLHYINNALKAHHLFFINKNYIVKDDEVIIVDEFTGRLSEGRRWGDGQHQAIEAKEHVEIQKETKTIATITYQNFFLLYNKLSGMTGTANTEASEFYNTYKLETIVVPTNKAIQRKDSLDIIYYNFEGKIQAIIEDIKFSHKKGQPILVGTASIESSELISNHLKQHNIPHQVLNAKFHALEAEIISQAGKIGAVTIATNMAGRGTDIILGGNVNNTIKNIEENENLTPEEKINLIKKTKEQWDLEHEAVIKAGGLKVIGVEKNEARRIDNQLRGRAGRQGDPGESIFYLSLDDDLFRIFGGDRVKNMMARLAGNDVNNLAPIQSKMISKILHDAQVKIENNNYNVRKALMEYDTILNEQRQAFYKVRKEILFSEKTEEYVLNSFNYLSNILLSNCNFSELTEESSWDFNELNKLLMNFGIFEFSTKIEDIKNDNFYTIEEIQKYVLNLFYQRYHQNKDLLIQIEKAGLLNIIDSHWQTHLSNMSEVKNFIHLRGYAQKDPKQEYKKEAHTSFMKFFEEAQLEYGQFILNIILQIEIMNNQANPKITEE